MNQLCRTCQIQVLNTSFFPLDFSRVDSEPTIKQKLSNCIPQLDLSIVPNAVICGTCAVTINSLYIFKKECLQLEIQIHEYIQQVPHTGKTVDLAAVVQFHQLRSKPEPFEITENDNHAIHTIIENKEFITSLAMVDRECVLFNTFDNFTDPVKSEAEENSEPQDLQVLEKTDNCIQNQSLKSHTQTHTNDKPFKCVVCKYSFSRIGDLKLHVSTHTAEKPFTCSVCQKSFNQKLYLKNHMKTHTSKKQFQCAVCEYSLSRTRDLERHILTHTGEKPFKCLICEFRCNQKQHLKRHMLTHTGEKPFTCSVCGHSFNRKDHLKSHMLTHTGEKPFTCSVCGHSFNRKDHLKSHMLTHTGENPFKCSVCEYSCNHKQSLKSHMLTHIGEKR